MRGSVAFRPLFFSSSAWVMAGRIGPAGDGPLEFAASYPAQRGERARRAHVHVPHVPARCIDAPPLLAAVAGCAGCSSLQRPTASSALITPYRVDIVQGNVVTKEQVARVKPGMTREQVRDMLGSPLLTDAFHADRWDYVFTIRRQGTEPQRRSVVALLQGRRAEAPRGARTADGARVRRLDRPSASRMVAAPELALTDEQRKALPPPAKAARAAAADRRCGAEPRRYPPLRTADDAALRIAVAGASGRMGRMLIEAVRGADDCGWAARSTSPAARRSARTARPSSAAQRRAHQRRPARRPGRRPGADRLHPPRRHAGAPGGVPRARRQGGHRHHRLQRRAEGRDRRARAPHRHRDGAQHERRRQRRASSCSTWPRARWPRATTSRSSRPTTATRSMRPAAPRWRWARWWPRALGRDLKRLRGLRAAKA